MEWTIEQLDKLISHYDWSDFENDRLGIIPIPHPALLASIRFTMRVGLYFGEPTQAIMACGKFIRMRPAQGFDKKTYVLKELDPDNIRLLRNWKPDIRWNSLSFTTGIKFINPILYGTFSIT
jgi:hypothetical protein